MHKAFRLEEPLKVKEGVSPSGRQAIAFCNFNIQ
jgi:hypothetical protein